MNGIFATIVKLSELQATRTAMTPGVWWVDEADGGVCAGPSGPDALDVGQVDWSGSDITGMLHTHNAADVLIEYVRTDLEFRAATVALVIARSAWRRASNDGAPGAAELLETMKASYRRRIECEAANAAARRKVTL